MPDACQTVFRSVLFGQISAAGSDSQLGMAGIMMSCIGICELPASAEKTEMEALILRVRILYIYTYECTFIYGVCI